MRRQTGSLATRLRAAWEPRAPRHEPDAPAVHDTPEDFAARLRAALESRRR